MSYNGDHSANVTPTAEISGIDDVSDWIEGSYRPLCTVRPKIQLNNDATWVGGTRVALGRAVDQVHTGPAVYVPANGSSVGLDFAVEADVFCSGAPNPTYYQYPSLAYLISWSNVELYYWSLEGFEPAQYNPPYYVAYCPSAAICPVNYGVASIKNFVDFADFVDIIIGAGAYTKEVWNGGQMNNNCSVSSSCTNGPPLCSVGSVHVSDGVCRPAWDTYFLIYKETNQPWRCFSQALALPTSNISPQHCTPVNY